MRYSAMGVGALSGFKCKRKLSCDFDENYQMLHFDECRELCKISDIFDIISSRVNQAGKITGFGRDIVAVFTPRGVNL